MNKQYLMPIVLFFILSLAATACQPAATSSTSVPAGNGPIIIGASLPLTGDFSDPGTAAQRGYQVWQALINQNGGLLGRQIQLKFVDNGSDPKKASADYESLISVDKVDLVVGTFSSLLVIPTSAVAAQHSYAYVEPAGGAAGVFNRGLKNIFFAQPGQSVQNADPFALYVLGLPADTRPKTFAIVSLDDPFTTGVTARLKGLLTEGGLTLLYETTYPGSTTDFSSIANTVAQLNPDMIIGGTQTDDSVAQIKAYQAANYQPRIAYFTNGPTIPDSFRKPLGAATEGVFSSISWFSDAHEYENDKFVAKYIELFGGTPANIPEDSANAFTVGQVLQQAAENIKSIDNTALINELHHSTYKTVVGTLSFDETGAPQGNYMLLQWQGDNFVIVGPGSRAEADPKAPPKPNW